MSRGGINPPSAALGPSFHRELHFIELLIVVFADEGMDVGGVVHVLQGQADGIVTLGKLPEGILPVYREVGGAVHVQGDVLGGLLLVKVYFSLLRGAVEDVVLDVESAHLLAIFLGAFHFDAGGSGFRNFKGEAPVFIIQEPCAVSLGERRGAGVLVQGADRELFDEMALPVGGLVHIVDETQLEFRVGVVELGQAVFALKGFRAEVIPGVNSGPGGEFLHGDFAVLDSVGQGQILVPQLDVHGVEANVGDIAIIVVFQVLRGQNLSAAKGNG